MGTLRGRIGVAAVAAALVVSIPAPACAGTLTTGGFHSLWVADDGLMWGAGYNATGALGNGTFVTPSTPTPVGYFSNWTSVSGGYYSSYGIRADGSLWAWGYNNYGQLGIGSKTTKASPVRVSSPATFTAVAAGAFHVLAIRSDGTLWAWGRNDYGQLGNGSRTMALVPTQVGSANDWATVTAGAYHSGAGKRDGSQYVWGYNYDGQLGDGSAFDYDDLRHVRLVPGLVSGPGIAQSLHMGAYHTLAMWAPQSGKGGQLTSVGTNRWGQLGNGEWGWDVLYDSTWNSIASALPFSSVAPGAFHNIALRPDGTLYAWGRNLEGQVGNGTTATVEPFPVSLAGIDGVDRVAAGESHSLATRTDGTLWGWGTDAQGQLALPGTVGSRTPKQITSLKVAYVSTPSSPSYIYYGKTITATGKLLPIHSGPVKAMYYRKSGTKWVLTKTLTATTARTSTYTKWTTTWRPTARGTWAVRGYHTDAQHQPSYGALRTFTVK